MRFSKTHLLRLANRQITGWPLLGLQLGPLTSDKHVLGWTILTNSPDEVLLFADGSSGIVAEMLIERQRDTLCFASFIASAVQQPVRSGSRLTQGTSGRFEPADGDERSIEEYALERATLDRARSERQVIEAVAAARSKGIPRTRIGAVLGTSAQAAQQRYRAVVEPA